mgnify:CR=1 FL=1
MRHLPEHQYCKQEYGQQIDLVRHGHITHYWRNGTGNTSDERTMDSFSLGNSVQNDIGNVAKQCDDGGQRVEIIAE